MGNRSNIYGVWRQTQTHAQTVNWNAIGARIGSSGNPILRDSFPLQKGRKREKETISRAPTLCQSVHTDCCDAHAKGRGKSIYPSVHPAQQQASTTPIKHIPVSNLGQIGNISITPSPAGPT